MTPLVASFHDAATGTFTHVVHAAEGGRAAIVDPVLDYDLASGAMHTASAERVLAYVAEHGLGVDWILETHAHADHLTAAAWLRERTGARVGIGRGIVQVQARFRETLGLGADFRADGSQFDRLFDDGDEFAIGTLRARAMATPGHTDDSLTYVIGDAAFVGDTVFAPDTGTGRTDFPGGSAAALHASIQKIFALPDDTRVFLCHDYPSGRAAQPWFPLQEQRRGNVHVGTAATHADYVAMRTARDATLPPPKLMEPALRANLRGGVLPQRGA